MKAVLEEFSGLIVRAAPLAPAAAGLISGVALDAALALSVFLYIAAFLAAALALAFHRVRRLIGPFLLFAAAVSLGGVLHYNAMRAVPVDGIERFAGEERQLVRVEGVIISPPRVLRHSDHPFARWTFRSEKTVFLLSVRSIRGMAGDLPVGGRVRVTVGEAVLDLLEGEPLVVSGWLTAVPRGGLVNNPGSFDWAGYLRRQGVVAQLRTGHRENVVRLDPDFQPRSRLLARFRQQVRGLLISDLAAEAEEEASLLEAMILGHRSRVDRRLNEVFIRAGAAHFLAVSGIHVVIVMFFSRLLSRLLLLGPRGQTWGMMVAVGSYMLLAEPRPSILRAGTIALIYCVARLMGRERACLNWIGASAILLVVINPVSVFEIGFQLSFAACIGVSYLTPAIVGTVRTWRDRPEGFTLFRTAQSDDLKPASTMPSAAQIRRRIAADGSARVRAWLLNYFGNALAVTIGAWLATAPIVAWHFQRIQPWGAINSLLMMFPVTVVMGLGFAKIIANLMAPALSGIVSPVLLTADALLIRGAEMLGSLPAASTNMVAPPWWFLVFYYGFLLCFIWHFAINWYDRPTWAVWTENKDVFRRWSRSAVAISLALLIAGLVGWRWPSRQPDRLVVTVLAVGAGTATVIELPDGRVVLYDAGSSGTYDVGRGVIVPFLRLRGVRTIDRVYLSHPDMDHFSGLPSVMEAIPTGPVIVNEYYHSRSPPRSPSRHLLNILHEGGGAVQVLDPQKRRWELGGVTFELLWPVPELDETVSSNDTSTLLRLSFSGRSILLTGDIETASLRALLASGGMRAGVLLLPHHGSIVPLTGAFIESVDPVAVIRSSRERIDERPGGLTALVADRALFNTADDGAIQVVFDKEGIRFDPLRRPADRSRGSRRPARP